MFISKIFNPTTAEITWQHNCHKNTALSCATIQVRKPERLLPVIEKNKAAWLRRTFEEYLTISSRALISQTKSNKIEWQLYNQKPSMVVKIVDQPQEWRDKWEVRRKLRIILSSMIETDANCDVMVHELLRHKENIKALVPPKGSLRHESLNTIANELVLWLTNEAAVLKSRTTVWSQ